MAWRNWPWVVRGPLTLLRFFLRLLRDIDGLFTFLASKPFRKKYQITGACKKRGVCCQNIAIYLSDGFWQYPFLKALATWWYTFVYNFSFKGNEAAHRVIIFKCNYLQKDGSCGIYRRRPFICRNFPAVRFFQKPTLLPGCGYKVKDD
jgi:hypothetical protein